MEVTFLIHGCYHNNYGIIILSCGLRPEGGL